MTKAAFLPSRPPRPNIWDNSQAFFGSPKQVQIIEATQKLTNAHSDPYVRQVAAHSSTIRRNEKPAVPGCTKCEILPTDFANKSRILCLVLPSPQRCHDSFLFLPRIVTTELLNVGGTEVLDSKRLCLFLSPCSWIKC